MPVGEAAVPILDWSYRRSDVTHDVVGVYPIWTTHTPQDEIISNTMGVSLDVNRLVTYSIDDIPMYTHCGTYIDTSKYLGYSGGMLSGCTAEERRGSPALEKCGPEKHPPILAPDILLDVAALHRVDTLPPSCAMGRADLEACFRHQIVVLKIGNVILIRIGQREGGPT